MHRTPCLQKRNFSTIFFGLPAAVLCGITVASHHCNSRNIVQLKRSIFKVVVIIISLFIIAQNTNAQTVDSNYVDTLNLSKIDTGLPVTENDEAGYDDNDDGYVDTTIKHIYDTSQYFFNWKEYINDTYAKEKIAQRHLIDADIKALKTEEDFWYIPAIEKMETRLKNDPKYRDSLLNVKNRALKNENDNSIFAQPWFNTLLWVIIIGIFLAAVVYFLSQNKINIFSRDAASSADEESENEQEDIFHLSYHKLIQKAEKEQEYRIAIRLMFLQTLKLLSDTNTIHYQPDYTNLHYLQQLHQSKYYNDFSKVSRSYEYAWYGKFDVSQERYAAIKNDFIKLQNRIT